LAVNQSMTFGWVLSLPTGYHLTTCLGPAPGSTQSSFHAEGYGMLLISHFLFHLFHFCGVNPDFQI
jgi:hypothetical protein